MKTKLIELLRSLNWELNAARDTIGSAMVTIMVILFGGFGLVYFVGQWPSLVMFGLVNLIVICIILEVLYGRMMDRQQVHTIDDVMCELNEIRNMLAIIREQL